MKPREPVRQNNWDLGRVRGLGRQDPARRPRVARGQVAWFEDAPTTGLPFHWIERIGAALGLAPSACFKPGARRERLTPTVERSLSDRLTYGFPVREGVVQVNGAERVVWLEHVWNTGRRTRSWLVDPASVCPERIAERELPALGDQYRAQSECLILPS